ncbi:hypothetical protein [Snodgrassella sp. ESL0253]|nr:hypothetical protein [Snodgrassella sp. ESL0253]
METASTGTAMRIRQATTAASIHHQQQHKPRLTITPHPHHSTCL